MWTSELEAIKRKIRALSQLATNNPSEAEAMLAMKKVGDLLTQYNLTMDEVTLRDEPTTKGAKRGCVIAKIPHPGYYESMYSSALDSEQEQYAEHCAANDAGKNYGPAQPEGLRLDAETYAELLSEHCDWRAAEKELTGAYVEAFDQLMTTMAGFPTHISYESTTSPEFYNFETDRVFVHIPKSTVKKLFAISKADKHRELWNVIQERCTDRPGFISHYSNKLKDWLDKPIKDWDHNELETLLRAVISLRWDETDEGQSGHDFEWGIYYLTTDDESAFNAFQAGVNWEAFDKACAEKRAELETELREQGVEISQPRCDETDELFKGQ